MSSNHSFAGFLVNIRGASADAVNIEHLLESTYILAYDSWADASRGSATNSQRKVVQHLTCIAKFVLLQFPGLVPAYGGVPDVYLRLSNQLQVMEKQETKSQSDLIRDKLWLPFGVLLELASSHQAQLRLALKEGKSKAICAQLAMEAALLLMVLRYSWQSSELTLLEISSNEEIESEAWKAQLSRSVFLGHCG
jgi:hypothetical protein